MKRKLRSRKVSHSARTPNWQFDSTEFLLLAFVTVSLLVFFGWQTGLLPQIGPSVLGISTWR